MADSGSLNHSEVWSLRTAPLLIGATGMLRGGSVRSTSRGMPATRRRVSTFARLYVPPMSRISVDRCAAQPTSIPPLPPLRPPNTAGGVITLGCSAVCFRDWNGRGKLLAGTVYPQPCDRAASTPWDVRLWNVYACGMCTPVECVRLTHGQSPAHHHHPHHPAKESSSHVFSPPWHTAHTSHAPRHTPHATAKRREMPARCRRDAGEMTAR